MTTKHNVEFIFPTPVIMFMLDYDKDDLVKKIYEYKQNTDPDGVVRSNENGWHSNYHAHKHPLFFDFTEQINNKVGSIIEENTTKHGRITMIQSWFNINPPGAFNRKHTHPECHMSGVLWIKVPEKSGNLIFENANSHVQSTVIDIFNKGIFPDALYHKALEYQSIENKVILFPSYLLHHVEVNKSNEDRISFAFNINIQYQND